MDDYTPVDRELSWLKFNERVLNEARDPRNPLLERIKFLGIFSSNLDEFFMKRVGGLKRQVAAGVSSKGDGELSPAEQLLEIRRAALPLVDELSRCLREDCLPLLRAQAIELLRWEELTSSEKEKACAFFTTNVFPVLTPLAVDPGHPFPFISNLSTSLGVLLRHPDRPEQHLFARVKVPDLFPSWLRVEAGADEHGIRLISLHDLIRENLGDLFPGLQVVDVMFFRITRNADIERDEEDADDLLAMVEHEVRQRRFAQVVRIEHGPYANPRIMKLLMEELEVGEQDVYKLPLGLEFYALKPIIELNRPELKYPPWVPVVPAALSDAETSIFSVLKTSELLVHHPYESFGASVERFIESAVEDPKVIAIKMTLYRTGSESPFIPLLIRAAESGKQVVCLVELKARFDEEKNILVAQALEKAGVHVVYGIVGLKTHCKLALVVRQENSGVQSYVHIGTGNYHATTARLYTDLGFFTTDPRITEDVVYLFHYLTGRALEHDFRALLVAPINMKERFLGMLRREADHARQGRPARIIAKMNSLVEEQLTSALIEASRAGVQIDLLVRGICCLRPGFRGVSENIRVTSIIGRFLEHSRVFYFRNGAADPLDGEFFIGSADWMHRNLTARVEAIVPVRARAFRERLWELLDVMLRDQRQAWDMSWDGSYRQREPLAVPGKPETPERLGTHAWLMRRARERQAGLLLRRVS